MIKKTILALCVIGVIAMVGCKKEDANTNKNEQENSTNEVTEFIEFKLDGQSFREEYPDDKASGLNMTNNQNIIQINYTYSNEDDLKLNATMKFNLGEVGTLPLEPEISNNSYISLNIRDQNLILYSKSGSFTISDLKLVGQPVNDMQLAKVEGTFSGTFISKDDLGQELQEYTISEGRFQID
jgi:hypothetical protein